MARGGVVGKVRAFLVLCGIAGLVVAYSLITKSNPVSGVGDWLDNSAWLERARAVSRPAPVWQITVGDQPASATVAGAAVVIAARDHLAARRLSDGAKIWDRDVAWSAVGGGGVVVLAGRTGRHHGYDAIEPSTGAVRWSVGSAVGAWAFTDLVLDLTCPGADSCTLTARAPETGAVRWRAGLPGDARAMTGADPPLAVPRPYGDADPAPGPAPSLLGFRVGDQVLLLTSATGRRLHTYEVTKNTRVVVAGGRVVVSTATPQGSGCRLSVEGRDPDGDRRVWHLDGYDLKTSTGLGCEQRADPTGAGGLLDALGPDGHEVLLDAADGGRVLRTAEHETVLATDGAVALVRAADGRSVRAVRPGSGAPLWTRGVSGSVAVRLGPGVVLFTDPGADRLVALSRSGATLADVTSGATALGYASNGLVVHIGLRVGLIAYRGAAG